MASERYIIPEFFCNSSVKKCRPEARLLFIGLWNFCDATGKHPADYYLLKGEAFPHDEIQVDTTGEWVDELIKEGLLKTEISDRGAFWVVLNWDHWQPTSATKPIY